MWWMNEQLETCLNGHIKDVMDEWTIWSILKWTYKRCDGLMDRLTLLVSVNVLMKLSN